MIQLSTLLHDDTVHLNVPCSDRATLFQWIAEHFAIHTAAPVESIYDCLMQREALGSTGLGYGVAIPHGRLRGLSTAHIVFIRTAHAIDFDAPDGVRTDRFFALLVPEKATDDHLGILSEIAQILSMERVRIYLSDVSDPPTLLHALRHPRDVGFI